MTPSLEELPTKAKEAPSPHAVRLALLDTNPVFQCLGEKTIFKTFLSIRPLPYHSDQTESVKNSCMATPDWSEQLNLAMSCLLKKDSLKKVCSIP